MALKKIIPAEDAVALIRDGDVLATSGYGTNGIPEELLIALERRFLETGEPTGLTLIYAGGQGDGKERGLNRLGHEGLLKRVIGGHYGLIPKIAKLAVENKIEAYNFPEGVIVHLYRDIAARKPGTLTKVGLDTFVDPRLEGGKINDAAKEDLVTIADLGGKESLFFKALPINVVFIRGTTADPDGNITMERESLRLENLAMAMAARNSGGIVLCQVERVAQSNSLDARRVRVPNIFVDGVVVADAENHMQTYNGRYNPALSGEVKVPLDTLPKLRLDERKVVARRAVLELLPNSVVNLGLGLPELIGRVANEERIQDLLTLTVDPGVIGGVPLGGYEFGAALNFNASIDHPYQFDFIDGGGLDSAYLGFAECDRLGNINVSRFQNRIAGCGGFINISQNSKKVVFVSTFSTGGLETEIVDGKLNIVHEGKYKKFTKDVEQITFSGVRAAKLERDILYVTERCVFRLVKGGLALTEYAPGIDIDRDILGQLPFKPLVKDPKPMEAMIFQPSPMELRDRMLDINIDDRLSYDPETNTIFMNYAGMRVRNEEDLQRIKEAVDGILEPLGKRVYSIVNYDSFEADPDIIDKYMDLVRYVEKKYYIKVSRYTTSGFMRLKLGKELEKREVSSHVYETGQEAHHHLRER